MVARMPDLSREQRLPSKSITIIIGFLVGLFAAFLGIGGGVLILPLLILVFGLEPRSATGTSLGVVVFVVAASVAIEGMHLVLDPASDAPAWLAVAAITPTSMFAASYVTRYVARIPQSLLRFGFASLLWFSAYRLAGFGGDLRASGWFDYHELSLGGFVVLPLLGLLSGTVATLGIGGGVVLVPALALLFRDLSPLSCRSTTLLVILPTAMIGYLRHRAQATANPGLVRVLAPSCATGAVLGTMFVHRIDADWFTKVFAGFLFVAGLSLVLQRSRASHSRRATG